MNLPGTDSKLRNDNLFFAGKVKKMKKLCYISSMNIRTLSEEKTDYETDALPVALYPERMIKNERGGHGYYGRVINRGSFDIETIASDLVVAGSRRSKTQIIEDWHETCAAIIDRLINGCTVEAEYFNFSLQIKGLFEGQGDKYQKGRNSIELRTRPSEKLKQILADLDCKIAQGNTHRPLITSVYDAVSKTEDRVLTQGGFAEIRGDNIRLYGTDESVGVYFVPEDTGLDTIKLSEREIVSSHPGTLRCILPDSLVKGGRYRVRIVTQYMRTTKARKEPLSCMSAAFLTI